MRQELFNEILMARQRVYEVGQPTPLQAIDLPIDATVALKREDLSPVHSYKWRGAYNRMKQLDLGERGGAVVAASAGNHAQGVALAARKLGLTARIYMPLATPRMKQVAVARHGADSVEIILHGDSYDDAAQRAKADVEQSGATFVHPYDDIQTMGGQGTLADEVVMSSDRPIDVAFLQIGGGGMAAAVACWLKAYYPDIRIVGVEGVDQASMQAAIEAGEPVSLDHVDVFCDGTAVKRVGDLTYPLCRELIDEFTVVTNEEVCAAIQLLWEAQRCTPEPSGAMGLAGLLQQADRVKGDHALCVVCGANMDFDQLAWISTHAGIGRGSRHHFRFEIDEHSGTMLGLLETALDGLNIVEFQYGKVDEEKAWPVVGFEANDMQLDMMKRKLAEAGISYEEVTSEEDVEFRIINYEPALFRNPFFITLEFPERAGALHDFLESIRDRANMCYFNYTFTGEQVGRALIGFEFTNEDDRQGFRKTLADSGHFYREISGAVLDRML